MKALFSLLTSVIVLTQVAFAQSEGYVGRFEFPVGTSFFPVSYVYDLTDVNACEALVQKEIFRVCIVRDKRAADATFEMTYQTPPAVSIDAAGQLVLGENAASAKWLTLNWTEIKDGVAIPITADYITVGDQAGVPKQFLYTNASGQSYYGFDVSTTEDLPAGTGKVYVYLVAMDTRMGTG
ncbi:MAG: hypothetical protein IJV69_06120, partial [Kiritimatiellae bacterium]|nr:hypothetical protein [Kiritimatiellia bacterium]